ncbi:MAG TPA: chloride channel protein [Acidimicrobiales bacterium]|nr:chloride channel protein [Acidimicrobiales bacterium]
MPDDTVALLRSRSYLVLLLFAAILGVPIAAAAYWFLVLVSELQKWVFEPAYLPKWLGFSSVPLWWPLPVVGVAGLLVGLAVRHLPGKGGHSPADGFQPGEGPPSSIELPGVALAALATLALGAVLGPEAPVIAIGGGLAAWAVRLVKPGAPPRTTAVLAAAGSFAAVSTLLGSPIVGAFLLMEAAGIGGPMLGLILMPGLLAAGVGSLIFIGLDAWTGHGTFALAIPNLPPFARPDVAQFAWAIVIGVAAAVLGVGLRRLALSLRPHVDRRVVLLTVVAGLAVGGLAVAFDAASAKSYTEVLFSGQSALPSLVTNSATFSVATLLLIVACKGLAYGVSMSAFRGGPTFPAMFIGAAGGIALSHLPGLPPVAGAAMGIGAMTVVMLRLPLTSVLLTTVFLAGDGVALMPLVIVAVVVAYVTSAHLAPRETPEATEGAPEAPASAPTPVATG